MKIFFITRKNHLINDYKVRYKYFFPNLAFEKVSIFKECFNDSKINFKISSLIILHTNEICIPEQYRDVAFNVDFNDCPQDGWNWFHALNLSNCNFGKSKVQEDSQIKWNLLHNIITSQNFDCATIFGTGPSLSNASSTCWEKSINIVCNTIVRDKSLWNHISPHIFVAGDANYHFGFTDFAKKFREDLHYRLSETNTNFVYPIHFDQIVQRDFSDFESRLLPIEKSSSADIMNDLRKSFQYPPIGNILNILLLPLATNLHKRIQLLGFDGRSPDAKYFWDNSPKHSYPELFESLLKNYPAFFNHFVPKGNAEKYVKDVHGDKLEKRLCSLESLGFKFEVLNFSFTPALQKRCRV